MTKPDIFLSYSRDDQATARKFAEGFERAGFSVWWDVTLKSGEDYDKATEQALRGAKAVVVLWSKKSVESRWVRTEATIALQSQTLVPVMIEACQRPIMFELSQTADLSHWKGDSNDKAWLGFLNDVQHFVSKDAPTGISTAAATPQPIAAKRGLKFIAPALVAIVAVLAALFFLLRHDKPASAIATTQKSIAVLPFADLSEAKDQEYFTDGLSEEVLNRLAHVQSLQVAARTSSFYYKGRNESMRTIGEQLGVDYILEGSVRKAGDSVRISAQLIKANDGFQVFSESYDRKLEDIFAVQGEIAQAVTTALSVSLAAGEFNRPGMTRNVQAYEAYLRRNFPNTEVLKTIEALKQAVAIDPEFGLAWNDLYRAYELSTISLPASVSADFNDAKQEALQRAGQLMPDSPDYLVSKAMAERRQTHWQIAEQLFLQVLTKSGNSDAMANLNYGEFLWSVGRVTDALPYLQRAKRLDPKDVDIATRLGATLFSVGQPQAALAEAERGLALAPKNSFIGFVYRSSLAGSGDFKRLQEVFQLDKTPPLTLPLIQALQLKSTDAKAVPAALNNLKTALAGNNRGPALNTSIGTFVAIAGDADYALTFFSAAANGNLRDIFGALMIWQPYMSDMRKLPGFKKLASDAGLADYWHSSGKWADFCKPLPATEKDFECN